ncbi:MAG: acetamidase/formamidase family protein [Candidatus Bathyarchaeia archaeon]
MKRLSLSLQGKLNYTISPSNKPTLTVEPGETVVVETEDAFTGQIKKPGDKRDTITIPYPNPQTGPILVRGAEKGDTLVVEIRDIKPTLGQGATRIPSYWWYLGEPGSSAIARFLSVELPHGSRICPIRDSEVYFSERIILPYEPFIGTIGTAPEIEALSTYYPGPHGGNMDLPDVCVGNRLYLPIRVGGALLHLGDVHAVQGDAEICGTAVEIPAECTLVVDLIKGVSLPWPRIESPDHIMAVSSSGSGRTLEDAIRIAFIELIRWLEGEHGFDRWDAYQLCTQVARVRLGNLWTVAAKFPKKYLTK